MRLLQIILMLCMLPDKPLFKVNLVTGLDMPYNIKPEPLGMFVTLLEISYKRENNSQWHGPEH